MRVFFLATLLVALSGLGTARADDLAFHLALQTCGQDHDLQACNDLVGKSASGSEERATAYAARGITRLWLMDLPGAQADFVAARGIDANNNAVQLLRTQLVNVASDPWKKPLFHCVNTQEKDFSKRIDACTQLINLRGPKIDDRAQDYELRSNAYFDAGDFASARADLVKATQIDPMLPAYRADLAIAIYASGDYQTALAQAEDAIARAPFPPANLILMRGQLLYLLGRGDEAISAYQASLKLNMPSLTSPFQASLKQDSTDLEPEFWRNLIRMERHEDVTADLQHLLTQLNPDARGTPIIQFLLGQIAAPALLDDANRGIFEQRPERLCLAYFNLGHKAWLSGDIADARQDFREALQTKKYGLIEYQVSKVLLQKLGG